MSRQSTSDDLHETQARLRTLLRLSRDWLWETDAAWRYTYTSARVQSLLGYAPEEVLGQCLFDLLAPGDAARVQASLEAAAAEQAPVEDLARTCVTAQGEKVRLLASAEPIVGDDGALLGYRGVDRVRDASPEERYAFMRRVLDNNPNFVFVRDREGRFVLANRAIAEAYGTTVEDLVGKTDADFNPSPESLAAIRRSDQRVFDSLEETFIPETPIIRDGRWVQTTKRPLFDDEGEARWIMGISSDITERKRMEEEIQRLLERRQRQVQTSTEVAQEIAAATALDELFLRVVTLVKERFGYYHAQIFRYDPDFETEGPAGETGAMRLVVGYGDVGAEMLAANHHLPIGRGVVGTAASTGQPVLASDVAQDPDWVPNRFLPETQGELAVPIKLRDQILGILDVQSDVAGALTEEDQLLLEGLCGQIAIAIESTQLLEAASTFRQMIEASGQGIGMATLEGIVTYANPTLCRMVGVEGPEAIVGQSFLAYYPEAMQERMAEEVLPTVMSQGHWQGEMAFARPGGTALPTLEHMFLIRDEDGTPLYIATQITDITERKRMEDALALERHLLRAMLDSVPDHLYFKDAESRFIRVSRAMAEWVGVEGPEDVVGKTDFDFFADEHARQAFEDEQSIIETGEPLLGVEEKETWPDGSVTWVTTTKLPLYAEDGTVIGTFGISTDITERKQAEVERERQAQQLQAALDETATLYRASQIINTATSTDEVLLGLMVGVELPDVIYADLNLFNRPWIGDDMPEYADVVAVWRPPMAQAQEAEAVGHVGDRFDLGTYPAARFLRPDEPMTVSDVQADARLDASSQELLGDLYGARSIAILPLVVGGRWIGYFNPMMAEPVDFDRAHLRRLMALTGQAAAAIQNLNLLEQTQQQLTDLATVQTAMTELTEADTFEQAVTALLHHVSRAVRADTVSMFLVSEGQMTRVGLYADGEARAVADGEAVYELANYPLTQHVVQTREPLTLAADDPRLQPHAREAFAATGIMANATLPLVGRERVIGTLSVNMKSTSSFSEHDVRILQTLANQAAVAFENLRLLEGAQDSARRQQALREITALVSVSTDVQDLAQRLSDIVVPLQRLVPLDRMTVAAHTPGEAEFELFAIVTAADRGPEVSVGQRELVEGTASGWVLTNREPLLIPDIRQDMAFPHDAQLVEAGIYARAVLPLLYGDQVVGTLSLGSSQPGAYGADRLPLLQQVAAQLAQALEHARLLERTQSAMEEVEATHRSYLQKEWQDYLERDRALRQRAFVFRQGAVVELEDYHRPEMHHSLEQRALSTTEDVVREGGAQPDEKRKGLAVPIEVRGQVLGVLGFEDPEGQWEWSEEQKSLIESVADQLGQALETARLLETTQRRALRERLTTQITDRMRRATTMDELLQTTVEAMASALQTPKAFVQLPRRQDEGAAASDEDTERDPVSGGRGDETQL